ncbi:MAG TPA: hypothetical protein VHE11_08700 [Steroidobacteraceae bacterium]|nr:hypothetical protein [Steroidobacteraceae bacterium]
MSSLKVEIATALRRMAAKLLGEYPPPRLLHARELLAELEAALSRQSVTGEWAGLAADITRALREGGADDFLRLPPVAKTVHPRIRGRSRDYLRYLLASKRFSADLQRALTESPVGRPLVNPHYPLSSPLLVQHGYHLARLLEATDVDPSALRLVVDFGAGYGSFFRLLRNLGYRERYVIWDLPVMCALQRFYLRNVFPTGPGAHPPGNLEWLISGEEAAPAVVGRHCAEHQPSLFVATWSLSETPLTVRERIAPVLAGFTHVLCAYQGSFGEHDNVRYFKSLETSLPAFDWHHAECPIYRGNYYLIGARAAAAAVSAR